MSRFFIFFLWLIAFAIVCLIVANLFSYLGLGNVAAIIGTFASHSLVFAYSLIILLAAYILLIAFCRQLLHYFHPLAKKSRYLAYLHNKQQQLQQQQAVYRYHIDYSFQAKRLRALQANNKKQIRSLSCMINKDLHQLRKDISKQVYQLLKAEQRLYTRQQHIEGLIQLHQKIIAKLD